MQNHVNTICIPHAKTSLFSPTYKNKDSFIGLLLAPYTYETSLYKLHIIHTPQTAMSDSEPGMWKGMQRPYRHHKQQQLPTIHLHDAYATRQRLQPLSSNTAFLPSQNTAKLTEDKQAGSFNPTVHKRYRVWSKKKKIDFKAIRKFFTCHVIYHT